MSRPQHNEGGDLTLQYRRRSRYHDEVWRQRVQLCERVLTEYAEAWCRSDAPFPVERFVAVTLYLFSRCCPPERLPPAKICEFMAALGIDDPRCEYELTWPDRSATDAAELIDELTAIMKDAVAGWCVIGMHDAAPADVVARLTELMTARHYIVLHHG